MDFILSEKSSKWKITWVKNSDHSQSINQFGKNISSVRTNEFKYNAINA